MAFLAPHLVMLTFLTATVLPSVKGASSEVQNASTDTVGTGTSHHLTESHKRFPAFKDVFLYRLPT